MNSNRNCAALLAAVVWFGSAAGAAAGANVFVAEGDGEVVDLADLRDGEARVFGQGDRAITAIREGGEIRITRDAQGEAKPLSIRCTAGTDSCVVTTSDDGESVVVRVEKSRACSGSDADCVRDDVDVVALGAGHSDTRVLVKHIGGAAADGLHWVDADPEHNVFFVGADLGGSAVRIVRDRVRLACPEGDATLWVEPAEAEQTFLCPKHSQPLERAAETRIERILVGGAAH